MPARQIKLPFYELDRMILSCFGKHTVLRAAIIIDMVTAECSKRRLSISREEITDAIWRMIEVGGLAPIGPLSKWMYCDLRPALYDY